MTSTSNDFQLPLKLLFETERRLENSKIQKVDNLNELLNSSKDRISSFLKSCYDPKTWLMIIVS